MILFSNNNTKYLQTKKIKILKITKNVSDNSRFYPNPAYKNENERFCAETHCPCVWIHNDLHTRIEKMSAPHDGLVTSFPNWGRYNREKCQQCIKKCYLSKFCLKTACSSTFQFFISE